MADYNGKIDFEEKIVNFLRAIKKTILENMNTVANGVANFPSPKIEGNIYRDTSTGKAYIYDGTNLIPLVNNIKDLVVGKIDIGKEIGGDSAIRLWDDNSNVYRKLIWDDSENRMSFEDGNGNMKYIASESVASTTVSGFVELATNAEALAGTDTTRAVTPSSLEYTLSNRKATTTRFGIVELATSAEISSGTSTTRVISVAGLMGRLATEAKLGLVRMSTAAQTIAGTSRVLGVTPYSLRQLTSNTGRVGLIETATVAEANAGTDDTRAITALGMANYVDVGSYTGVPPVSAFTGGKKDIIFDSTTGIEYYLVGGVVTAVSSGSSGGGTWIEAKLDGNYGAPSSYVKTVRTYINSITSIYDYKEDWNDGDFFLMEDSNNSDILDNAVYWTSAANGLNSLKIQVEKVGTKVYGIQYAPYAGSTVNLPVPFSFISTSEMQVFNVGSGSGGVQRILRVIVEAPLPDKPNFTI